MKGTKIEWTKHTWNPIRGCTKISAGCDHCYAASMSLRNPKTLGVWGAEGARSFGVESYWKQPAKWNAEAEALGEVHSVFCASLADLFEGEHEQHDGEWSEFRRGPRPDYLPILDRMVETFAPLKNLRVLALTKRPWNALRWSEARGGWPESWWLGTSVENQAAADERIPWLLRVPAQRFLSCEPLLGPVRLDHMDIESHPAADGLSRIGAYQINALTGRNTDMGRPCPDVARIHWVIAGGESGPGARPMHPDWARGLRDQCVEAGTPYFFKQWGEHAPVGDGRGGAVAKVGKKAAGRVLDGRTWDEAPGQQGQT